MNNFILGIITGIVLSTVGFQGLSNLGNRAINGVETFATSQQ
jgi:hypothetical protein